MLAGARSQALVAAFESLVNEDDIDVLPERISQPVGPSAWYSHRQWLGRFEGAAEKLGVAFEPRFSSTVSGEMPSNHRRRRTRAKYFSVTVSERFVAASGWFRRLRSPDNFGLYLL